MSTEELLYWHYIKYLQKPFLCSGYIKIILNSNDYITQSGLQSLGVMKGYKK